MPLSIKKVINARTIVKKYIGNLKTAINPNTYSIKYTTDIKLTDGNI